MSYDVKPAGTPLAFGVAPYPFVEVAGTDALAALEVLRGAYPGTTPVIWGNDDQAARLFELFDEPSSVSIAVSLAEATGASGDALLAARRVRVRDGLKAWYAKRGEPCPDFDADELDAADAPTEVSPSQSEPHRQPLGYIDYRTNAPFERILIGLLPTPSAWETAAYHKFGDWNACPSPAIHVALAREWAERFGARVIVNTSDVIEFEVDRPVATLDEARALARRHYAYCGDIVDQGVGSIEALAHALRGGRFWYFWWD